MNKKDWTTAVLNGENRRPLPIISYPGVQFSGKTIKEVLSSSDLQAQVMKTVADRCDSAAAVTLMDLSVEAECFGAQISEGDNVIPAVKGVFVTSAEQAERLSVPKVGDKRSGIFIDTVKKAKELITDRPVLAGCVGPYSLFGRLAGVTEAMFMCFDEPEAAECLLKKGTEFIIEYIKAFKEAGADGIIIAEPVAGLLSPSMESEFSAPYIKRIAQNVISDDFIVIYHNCGENVTRITDSIYSNGCDAYHFGNISDMHTLLKAAPADKLIMGNIDPVSCFRDGTPDEMRSAVRVLLENCGGCSNFILSSGCDTPFNAKWENIEAFYSEAAAFYGE